MWAVGVGWTKWVGVTMSVLYCSGTEASSFGSSSSKEE